MVFWAHHSFHAIARSREMRCYSCLSAH